MISVTRSLVLLITWTFLSCARSEPPGARTIVPATFRAVGAAASSDAARVEFESDAARPPANHVAVEAVVASRNALDAGINNSSGATLLDPILFDEKGEPRPQTDELPIDGEPRFLARVELLCAAIIEGRSGRAYAAFFPIAAYRQVKDVADPDRDYRIRLLRHFDRDIEDYHRRVTKMHAPVKCSGIRIPQTQARWMKPGSEYNRIGYFRVLRSHLVLADADGNTTTLEVTSLISWRGQWYVVHLNGFE